MMFQWNTTNGIWKRVYSQFLSPMIQLYTKATVQSGSTACSVQRDLILLVNRPYSWRSPIFFHWSDRGIVRIFFCYSAVLRVVRAPSLPSSMIRPSTNTNGCRISHLSIGPYKLFQVNSWGTSIFCFILRNGFMQLRIETFQLKLCEIQYAVFMEFNTRYNTSKE